MTSEKDRRVADKVSLLWHASHRAPESGVGGYNVHRF